MVDAGGGRWCVVGPRLKRFRECDGTGFTGMAGRLSRPN